MHGVGWRLPVHELPTWPTLSPDTAMWWRQHNNMHVKQQFTHAQETCTVIVTHAGDIQHMLSSETLVGLGLVVGLTGLNEPVVPPRIGVLASRPTAALFLWVAED